MRWNLGSGDIKNLKRQFGNKPTNYQFTKICSRARSFCSSWSHSTHLSPELSQMILSTDCCAQTAKICSGRPIQRIRRTVSNSSARISETWSRACSSSTPLTACQWLRSVLTLGSQTKFALKLDLFITNLVKEKQLSIWRMRLRELRRKPSVMRDS